MKRANFGYETIEPKADYSGYTGQKVRIEVKTAKADLGRRGHGDHPEERRVQADQEDRQAPVARGLPGSATAGAKVSAISKG